MSSRQSNMEISSQNLLKHTAKRLFQSLTHVTYFIYKRQLHSIIDWSFVETAGQAESKQLF